MRCSVTISLTINFDMLLNNVRFIFMMNLKLQLYTLQIRIIVLYKMIKIQLSDLEFHDAMKISVFQNFKKIRSIQESNFECLEFIR